SLTAMVRSAVRPTGRSSTGDVRGMVRRVTTNAWGRRPRQRIQVRARRSSVACELTTSTRSRANRSSRARASTPRGRNASGATGYGGPQRGVVAVTRGLAALGHRVTLLALAGSRVPEAKVVEVPARKFDDAAHLAPYVPGDADILHAHVPVKPGPPGSNLPPL